MSTRALSTDPWTPRANTGLDTDIGEVGVLDAATVRRAQLTVCDRAGDVDEARGLLRMLFGKELTA